MRVIGEYAVSALALRTVSGPHQEHTLHLRKKNI
jgi:hypothetical protein